MIHAFEVKLRSLSDDTLIIPVGARPFHGPWQMSMGHTGARPGELVKEAGHEQTSLPLLRSSKAKSMLTYASSCCTLSAFSVSFSRFRVSAFLHTAQELRGAGGILVRGAPDTFQST